MTQLQIEHDLSSLQSRKTGDLLLQHIGLDLDIRLEQSVSFSADPNKLRVIANSNLSSN